MSKHWMRVRSLPPTRLPHRRASSGIAVDRSTDALLSQTELSAAWHCHTEIVPRWRQRAKKNGRSESGHR
ncbi:hypothetical protein, partial [Xanthomonas oryzae]|uniref:hypothetical protein n=1 Tax=Xanthomonas oryzae TaxID=347 RepID=UPI001ED9BD5F